MSARCSDAGCGKEARMALRTTRPTRDDLRTVIFYDDRTAPSTALRYCADHGLKVVEQLMSVLVDGDGS